MSYADSLMARLKAGRDDDTALELLEEFQSGFPIARLAELLAANTESGVRAGIWIASELGTQVRPLLADIQRLLAHPDRYVRFFALDCVLTAAADSDGLSLASAAALIGDPDSAVRWKAMNFLASVSRAQLSGAARATSDTHLHDHLTWLEHAEMFGPSAIRANLLSQDPRERLVAVIAAARIAEMDSSLLYEASKTDQQDIQEFAIDRLARLGR